MFDSGSQATRRAVAIAYSIQNPKIETDFRDREEK